MSKDELPKALARALAELRMALELSNEAFELVERCKGDVVCTSFKAPPVKKNNFKLPALLFLNNAIMTE